MVGSVVLRTMILLIIIMSLLAGSGFASQDKPIAVRRMDGCPWPAGPVWNAINFESVASGTQLHKVCADGQLPRPLATAGSYAFFWVSSNFLPTVTQFYRVPGQVASMTHALKGPSLSGRRGSRNRALYIGFSHFTNHVKVRVGFDKKEKEESQEINNVKATLRAFNAEGSIVAQASVLIGPNQTAILFPVEVKTATDQIIGVTVDFGPSPIIEVIDDLQWRQGDQPTADALSWPEVTIEQPKSDSAAEGKSVQVRGIIRSVKPIQSVVLKREPHRGLLISEAILAQFPAKPLNEPAKPELFVYREVMGKAPFLYYFKLPPKVLQYWMSHPEGFFPAQGTFTLTVRATDVAGSQGRDHSIRVTRAPLTAGLVKTFPESIFIGRANSQLLMDRDRDRDGLKDDLEGQLAEHFRPILIFDRREDARRIAISKKVGDKYYIVSPEEPVTIFQVRPKGCVGRGCAGPTYVQIRWVFLFTNDSGYKSGGCEGFGGHRGDNDTATYKLVSTNRGVTWELVSVQFGSLVWPENSPLKKEGARPRIYLSPGKHHEYFTIGSWDDSPHSNVPYWDDCSEDVWGDGDQVHPNLFSLGLKDPSGKRLWNNVGEPEFHHPSFFVNELSDLFFPPSYCPTGRNAWSSEGFCSSEPPPNRTKWLTHPITYKP